MTKATLLGTRAMVRAPPFASSRTAIAQCLFNLPIESPHRSQFLFFDAGRRLCEWIGRSSGSRQSL
jgi:hypothetical protein